MGRAAFGGLGGRGLREDLSGARPGGLNTEREHLATRGLSLTQTEPQH